MTRRAILVIKADRPEALVASEKIAAELVAADFELFTISKVSLKQVTTCEPSDLPSSEIVVVLDEIFDAVIDGGFRGCLLG